MVNEKITPPKTGFTREDIEKILTREKDIELTYKGKKYFVGPHQHKNGKLLGVDGENFYPLDAKGKEHEIKYADVESIEEKNLQAEFEAMGLDEKRHTIKRKYGTKAQIRTNTKAPLRNAILQEFASSIVTEEELDAILTKVSETIGKAYNRKKWFRNNKRYFSKIKTSEGYSYKLSRYGKKVLDSVSNPDSKIITEMESLPNFEDFINEGSKDKNIIQDIARMLTAQAADEEWSPKNFEEWLDSDNAKEHADDWYDGNHDIEEVPTKMYDDAKKIAKKFYKDIRSGKMKIDDLTKSKNESIDEAKGKLNFEEGDKLVKGLTSLVKVAAGTGGDKHDPTNPRQSFTNTVIDLVGDLIGAFLTGDPNDHSQNKSVIQKNKKLLEARNLMTAKKWETLSREERFKKLLTVFKDPDEAEKNVDKKFNQLSSEAASNMSEGHLPSFKEFNEALSSVNINIDTVEDAVGEIEEIINMLDDQNLDQSYQGEDISGVVKASKKAQKTAKIVLKELNSLQKEWDKLDM